MENLNTLFLCFAVWTSALDISVAVYTRSSLFWDVTQRRLLVIYRRFGANCRFHLQGSSSPRRPIKMWLIGWISMSVSKYL